MKPETIEYLRSLVNAEAKRPGSGQDFHKLMGALRELDALADDATSGRISVEGVHSWKQINETEYQCEKCGADSEGFRGPCM